MIDHPFASQPAAATTSAASLKELTRTRRSSRQQPRTPHIYPPHNHFQVGDEVFGCQWGDGDHGSPLTVGGVTVPVASCFAEYILVRKSCTSKKPAALSHKIAAAGGTLASITAYQGRGLNKPTPNSTTNAINLSGLDRAAVKSSSRILVLGGSGAVGQMAIQLAKARGAWVATTCSTRSAPFVTQFAPDRIVDYTKVRTRYMYCWFITVAFRSLADAATLSCTQNLLQCCPPSHPTPPPQENWWELKDLNVDAVFDTVGCDDLLAKAKVFPPSIIWFCVARLSLCRESFQPTVPSCPSPHGTSALIPTATPPFAMLRPLFSPTAQAFRFGSHNINAGVACSSHFCAAPSTRTWLPLDFTSTACRMSWRA